jgi:hypothetical protein
MTLRGLGRAALALSALLAVATCALMRGQDRPASAPAIAYGPPSPPYHGTEARNGGCGSRGGPGYRAGDGHCASWREKRERHRR